MTQHQQGGGGGGGSGAVLFFDEKPRLSRYLPHALAGLILFAAVCTYVDPRMLGGSLVGDCTCPVDAGGPRVVSIIAGKDAITITLSAPILPGTLTDGSRDPNGSFLISTRNPASTGNAWAPLRASLIDYQEGAADIRLTFAPGSWMPGDTLRVVLRGTGPAPILDERGVALAGVSGGPPNDGMDFAWQGIGQ